MPEPDPDKESKMATAEVLPIDRPANWAAPNSYMITTEDLWKTYDMGSEQVHALRGINLRIQRNEYVAIMGPSGSGKSTLMNLIGCLDYAVEGPILAERPTGQRTGRRRTGADPEQGDRIRVPDVQSAGARYFTAQCGAAADLCGRSLGRAHRARQSGADFGGHGISA